MTINWLEILEIGNKTAMLVYSSGMYRKKLVILTVCNACEIDGAVWKRGPTTRFTKRDV